jgi:hypothetical protein
MRAEEQHALLTGFLEHLHETGALSVPPEDLTAAVDRFAR